MWYYIDGETIFHRRYFMNIRRFIAAVLASLALLSFVGCKGQKSTGKNPLNAAGKANEAVSGEQPESAASEASDPASESDSTGFSKETQKPTAATTAKPNNPDIKSSKYFLGTDLDDWYHWNQIGDGYQEGVNYIKNWTREYNSHGDLVMFVTYGMSSDGEIFPSSGQSYEYIYNSNGTVKEITWTGNFNIIYRYEYDSGKRITKITSVDFYNGETTAVMTLSYNKSGKLIGVNHDEWKLRLSYDSSGRLAKKEKTYPDGIVETFLYEYNGRNDVVRKTENVKYSYCTVNNIYDYKYDENGALIKLTVTDTDGGVTEKEYTNDKYGNPTEIKETKSENGKVISSNVYPYTYEYEADKITVTGSDCGKKIYGYQKRQSVITPILHPF